MEFQGCHVILLEFIVASARVEPEIHWSKHLNECLGRPQEMFECVVERSEVCFGHNDYYIFHQSFTNGALYFCMH